MNQDLSIIHLLLNASTVVQIVVLILMTVSVLSWAVIFAKTSQLRTQQQAEVRFESDFWSGGSLHDLYQEALFNEEKVTSPTERIFVAGMREYLKLHERRIQDPVVLLDGARRAMKASYQRELDELEAQLPFLGSVASVSPYVGLLGTVWGIMHAFTGLASLAQVTLATVAPGIAEALVATAIGLFAAIPAVIAYNRLTAKIDRMATHMESFIDEFSNILQRNITQPAA